MEDDDGFFFEIFFDFVETFVVLADGEKLFFEFFILALIIANFEMRLLNLECGVLHGRRRRRSGSKEFGLFVQTVLDYFVHIFIVLNEQFPKFLSTNAGKGR